MNTNTLAVVTGGTKGIGRATVNAFAAQGFDIVTCSRNERELDSLKQEVEADFGVSVFTLKCDLSIKSETLGFVDFVLSQKLPVDVLVNNSGVFLPGEVHSEEDGALEKQIETNLYSAYRISRGLIPLMREQKCGHIFNICSIASLIAYNNGGSYTISKFALYGMSKSLREEMKPYGIRVTSVMPGATLTASWEGVDLPEERFIPAEDVASMILTTYQLSHRSVVEDIVIRPQLGDL